MSASSVPQTVGREPKQVTDPFLLRLDYTYQGTGKGELYKHVFYEGRFSVMRT